MKIYPEQLSQHLQKLLPVYLVAGDEPLQKIECADQIREFCKQQGILERQIIEESAANPLTDQAGTLSLFAETRLLEWRFDKPIKKIHGEAIQEFINNQLQDILLITAPKLSNEKRLAWYKTLEKQGLVVEVWPIPVERLAGWLNNRAKKIGVTLQGDAVATLIERCEGNLLSAHQDLQMLSLLAQDQPITSENIRQYVGENARYTFYELSDACLLGQAPRALRMLASLQAEGTYPLPIINQLMRECQLLADWSEQIQAGSSLAEIMQSQRVWPKRQKVLQAAMRSPNPKKWYALLQRLTFIDKSVKGQAEGDVWQELAQVICLIANVNPMRVKPASKPDSQISSSSVSGLQDIKKALGV
ncbi:MAG: DNA polymerase III subunit delta [Kangiellaceae bacterium]|nr:DNA polymerase III subunit delta [Kangiellaceae bacterium]